MVSSWVHKAKVHVAMVLSGAGYGGYYVLAKACLSAGVDPFVFAVYRDAIGFFTLFLYASFFEREQWPKMTLETAGLVLAMAAVGVYLMQALFLVGLQYTNVVFSSIMMNCVPVWAFLIAVIFRVEAIYLDRRDGQAKTLGIFCCVTGATLLTLYRGPVIFGDSTPMSPIPGVSLGAFPPALQGWEMDSWTIGALYLLLCSICAGTFFNLQASALKRFPAPFTLMSLSALLGSFMFAGTVPFRVKEASDWILTPGPDLFAAIYAGIVATGMCLFLGCWVNHQRGPILVAAYSPLQPIFSTFFGIIFFNNALYTGSLLGATSILSGLWLVIWGTQEDLRLSLQIPTHGKQPCLDTAKPTSSLVKPLLQ